MNKTNIEKKKSDFLSKGVRCDGDLLLPKNVIKPPVVIMAHGLAGQKDFGLMPYAENFVNEGVAVFLFDYRTFGKSDGLPRHLVDPYSHVKDWKEAINHVKTLECIDNKKIILWGSSFSGGHVINVGAEKYNDKDIIGIMSQVPFVGGMHSAKQKSLKDMVLAGFYGIYDMCFTFAGSPKYSPVIGKPGTFAALNSKECYDGFLSIIPKESTWKNEMTSRSFIKMIFYNPMKNAYKIQVPVLILGGKYDSLIPIDAVQDCSKKIRNCDFKVIECNHFEPYSGIHFDQFIHYQKSFLKNILNK
ncbi:unnamed protein product [Cunninghamella echinulata]